MTDAEHVVEALRGLDSEASKAPWLQEPDTRAGRVWVQIDQHRFGADCEPLFDVRHPFDDWNKGAKEAAYRQREKDAALIVAARNMLPALADFVEAADRLRGIGPSLTNADDFHASDTMTAYDAALKRLLRVLAAEQE